MHKINYNINYNVVVLVKEQKIKNKLKIKFISLKICKSFPDTDDHAFIQMLYKK